MRAPLNTVAVFNPASGETTVIQTCDDGAVFALALNGHPTLIWNALPPVPGTAAALATEGD